MSHLSLEDYASGNNPRTAVLIFVGQVRYTSLSAHRESAFRESLSVVTSGSAVTQ